MAMAMLVKKFTSQNGRYGVMVFWPEGLDPERGLVNWAWAPAGMHGVYAVYKAVKAPGQVAILYHGTGGYDGIRNSIYGPAIIVENCGLQMEGWVGLLNTKPGGCWVVYGRRSSTTYTWGPEGRAVFTPPAEAFEAGIPKLAEEDEVLVQSRLLAAQKRAAEDRLQEAKFKLGHQRFEVEQLLKKAQELEDLAAQQEAELERLRQAEHDAQPASVESLTELLQKFGGKK